MSIRREVQELAFLEVEPAYEEFPWPNRSGSGYRANAARDSERSTADGPEQVADLVRATYP